MRRVERCESGLWHEAKKREARFVLCVENTDYPSSLECRKVYQVLGDEQASKHGQVRVIDESGEDYLYPGGLFRALAPQLIVLSKS
jgi:hypothetical protein